jgi:hypothetical protein
MAASNQNIGAKRTTSWAIGMDLHFSLEAEGAFSSSVFGSRSSSLQTGAKQQRVPGGPQGGFLFDHQK